MITFKRHALLIPLLLLVLLLAACGTQPTNVAEQEGGFLLALPRITIDIDSNGVPSIAGVSPDTIRTITFGQVDISQFQFPTAYVEWFTRTNLQHMELVHKNDGLFLFVNGKPLPHLGWTGGSLSATGELVGDFGLLDPGTARLVRLLIPFVQRTGIDLAVRFPMADGATVVPLRDPSQPISSASDEAGSGIAQVRIHVDFDRNGVPSILSVSTRDLESAFGASLRQLEVGPAMVESMQSAGLQHVTVRTTSNGLLLWVNDQALPHLVWSNEYLQNSADLYGQLYYTRQYEAARNAVAILLPVITDLDAEVAVRFPVADGATPIPLPSR